MCLFETPFYIYYSHIAVFVLCFLTAILILIVDPKKASNRSAFYFILAIALLVADVFGQWTIHSVAPNKFLVEASIVLVVLIPLLFVYFSYHYTHTELKKKTKLLLALPVAVLAIFAFSKYAFDVFNVDDCFYAEGKWISFASYLLEIFYTIWAVRVLVKYYRLPQGNIIIDNSIRILVPAFCFYTVWNIVFSEIDRISFYTNSYIESTPHFITGTLFFISLIAFAIIKKDFFEFPMVITSHYTVVVWTLIFLGFIFFYSNLTLVILAAVFYVILMIIFWKM